MSRKTYVLRGAGDPETLLVEGRADSWSLTRDGQTTHVHVVALSDGRLSVLRSDGRQFCGRAVARLGGQVEVSTALGVRRLALADWLRDRVDHSGSTRGTAQASHEVRALMPGRVIDVGVAPGDRVEPGSLLLVIEAMKMQNEIRAENAGVVKDVRVASGDAIDSGALILIIEAEAL